VTRLRVLFVALFMAAVSCGGNGTDADALAEGDRAPTFTLPSASGGKVELSDFAGEKPVLLYFSMGPG
jgi:hypothetical protein